jgi:hypothetical protein
MIFPKCKRVCSVNLATKRSDLLLRSHEALPALPTPEEGLSEFTPGDPHHERTCPRTVRITRGSRLPESRLLRQHCADEAFGYRMMKTTMNLIKLTGNTYESKSEVQIRSIMATLQTAPPWLQASTECMKTT